MSTNISKLTKDLSKFSELLDQYEGKLANVKDVLSVRGKTLEEALKEQASFPMYYDELRAEMKAIMEYVQSQVDLVRSQAFRKYTEGYSRALTDRAAEKYIDHEENYLAMNSIYLEVKEVYDKYVAVNEAFTKRGFALRDITAAKVAAIHTSIL